MNLSKSFQEVIEPMKRPVAIVALVASAFTLAGCASGGRLHLPEGNVGGIPVGRVLNQNANQNLYTAKKAIRDDVAGTVRLTPCPVAPQQPQPRTQGPGLLGNAIGAIGDAFSKTFSLNTTIGIGPDGCAEQSQVDQNGVGPRPTGVAPRQPR